MTPEPPGNDDWTARDESGEISTFGELLTTLEQLQGRGVNVGLYDTQATKLAGWFCWAGVVRKAGPVSKDGVGADNAWMLTLTSDDRVHTAVELPARQFRRGSRRADDDGQYFIVTAEFQTFRIEVTEAEYGWLDGEEPSGGADG